MVLLKRSWLDRRDLAWTSQRDRLGKHQQDSQEQQLDDDQWRKGWLYDLDASKSNARRRVAARFTCSAGRPE